MKNRMLCVFLALIVAFSACMVMAGAAETASGTCGDGLRWTLEDGVLTISGSGPMDDCTGGAPWDAYKDRIKGLVLTGGVTYVGANAFTNYDALESVDLGSAVTEIGAEAFKNCDGLFIVSFPSTLTVLGEGSFESCTGLQELWFAGKCPSFKMNCLWNTYVTIYYPADRPWKAETIDSLTTAFKGRVTFLSSDQAGQVPEETTFPEETTVPEETEAPTTVPQETTAPTEPEQTTAAPTEPEETTLPAGTTAPGEPEQTTGPAAPDDGGKDGNESWSWLVIVLILAVIGVCVLAIALRPRKPKYRGKYSRRKR